MLTYDGFKIHTSITECLEFFTGYTTKVWKEEAGTSAFNQEYDKFQAKQDKKATRQLLYMTWWKVYIRINRCQLTMTIYTAIKIPLEKYGQISVLL